MPPDAPPAFAAQSTAAAVVNARTQLTIVLTDLELAHRILVRCAPGEALTPQMHACLVELAEDALRSGRGLAETLRSGRRAVARAPEVTGE